MDPARQEDGLGLAFKGGTDDIRESPAIAIIQELVDGAGVCAYNPAAMPKAKELLSPRVVSEITAENAYRLARRDALLVLTEWEEFAALDLHRLHSTMKLPIIIDGRNLYAVPTAWRRRVSTTVWDVHSRLPRVCRLRGMASIFLLSR